MSPATYSGSISTCICILGFGSYWRDSSLIWFLNSSNFKAFEFFFSFTKASLDFFFSKV